MTFPVEFFEARAKRKTLLAEKSQLDRIIDLNDHFPDRPKPDCFEELYPHSGRYGFRISGGMFPALFEITEVNVENGQIVAWTLEPAAEEIRKRPQIRDITCFVLNQ